MLEETFVGGRRWWFRGRGDEPQGTCISCWAGHPRSEGGRGCHALLWPYKARGLSENPYCFRFSVIASEGK